MKPEMTLKDLAKLNAEWLSKEASTSFQRAKLARQLTDATSDLLSADAPAPERLTAVNAAVEIIDEKTGHLYRRYLELAYDETDNGLRLFGDDISGSPVQIVFLSNTALERIHDLQGKGRDSARCEE